MTFSTAPQAKDNSNPTLCARFFVPIYLQVFGVADGKGKDGDTYISFRILPTFTFSSQDPVIALSPGKSPANGPSAVVLQK